MIEWKRPGVRTADVLIDNVVRISREEHFERLAPRGKGILPPLSLQATMVLYVVHCDEFCQSVRRGEGIQSSGTVHYSRIVSFL